MASNSSTDFTSFLAFARLFKFGGFEVSLVWCSKMADRDLNDADRLMKNNLKMSSDGEEKEDYDN